MKRWIAGAAALMVVASQAETVLPHRSYVELGYSAISYEVNAPGYVHSRGTAALGGDSAVNTDNGFSYGAGMRYHFDRTTFLNVDYMSYLHKSDYTAKGLTVGVGFKF